MTDSGDEGLTGMRILIADDHQIFKLLHIAPLFHEANQDIAIVRFDRACRQIDALPLDQPSNVGRTELVTHQRLGRQFDAQLVIGKSGNPDQ